jgi:hypothetical protein
VQIEPDQKIRIGDKVKRDLSTFQENDENRTHLKTTFNFDRPDSLYSQIKHNRIKLGFGLWHPGSRLESIEQVAPQLFIHATIFNLSKDHIDIEVGMPFFNQSSIESSKRFQLDLGFIYRHAFVSRINYEWGLGASAIKSASKTEYKISPLLCLGFAYDANLPWQNSCTLFAHIKMFRENSVWNNNISFGVLIGVPL